MKALLVGDSEDLLQAIFLALKVRWPELSLLHATEAREGTELTYREQPDIVMLQHGAASVDCFDLISQIRSFSDVGIIVLSQSDDVMDEVRALETGADDWITQPFMSVELLAKVNAVLRRCAIFQFQQSHAPSFVSDRLTIDYATRDVYLSGKLLKLTPIEFKILSRLARNEGRVVSRADLLHSVWGPDYRVQPEFLKKYIYRLRSKVEEDPTNPKIILNERGLGYILINSADST